MKWYWLTLIILAVLVVGFFVGKAVEKKSATTASASAAGTGTTGASVVKNPDGSLRLVA